MGLADLSGPAQHQGLFAGRVLPCFQMIKYISFHSNAQSCMKVMFVLQLNCHFLIALFNENYNL